MELKFKHENNIFFLEGTVNEKTIKHFKNHLEFLLFYNKALTINIDRLKSMNKKGIEILKEIHDTALAYHKIFSITGYGCKEIYDDFQNKHAA